MNEFETAKLKSDFAKSLSEDVTATVTNSEKNVIGLTAARDVIAQILTKFKDYSGNIDAALKDGTFPSESEEMVRAVHTDLTSFVEGAHKEISKAVDSQLFFTRGLQRAIAMIDARAKSEKDIADAIELARHVPAAKVEEPEVVVELPVPTSDVVNRIETEAAAALLASLPPEKPKRKRTTK